MVDCSRFRKRLMRIIVLLRWAHPKIHLSYFYRWVGLGFWFLCCDFSHLLNPIVGAKEGATSWGVHVSDSSFRILWGCWSRTMFVMFLKLKLFLLDDANAKSITNWTLWVCWGRHICQTHTIVWRYSYYELPISLLTMMWGWTTKLFFLRKWGVQTPSCSLNCFG